MDVLTRIDETKVRFKASLRKYWWGFPVIIVVDFIYDLLKHRILEATNRLIDQHVTFSWVRPALQTIEYSSFFHPLIVIVELFAFFILLLLVHAYWETRPSHQGSRPLLRGEITEGRTGSLGASSEGVLAPIIPWINVFLKLRVTNERQRVATVKNASLQLVIGQQKYRGTLEKQRGAGDPSPDLLTAPPIQHGVGSVGWLHFHVLELEMTNARKVMQADATVTLI